MSKFGRHRDCHANARTARLGRPRLHLLVCAAALVASFASGTPTASAAGCRSNADAAVVKIYFRSALATGRTRATIDFEYTDWPASLVGDVTVRAIGADGGVIATARANGDDLAAAEPRVMAVRGLPKRGAFRLEATWTEQDESGAEACFVTSRAVARTRGGDIDFRRWIVNEGDSPVVAGFDSYIDACDSLRVAPVTATVVTTYRSRTVRRRVRFADQCLALQGKSVSLPGGRLTLDVDGASLFIRARSPGFRYYELTARSANATRSIVISAFHVEPYRVFWGTDEYYNYCVKGMRETYMRDGYLFCWHTWWTRWWAGRWKLNEDGTDIVRVET